MVEHVNSIRKPMSLEAAALFRLGLTGAGLSRDILIEEMAQNMASVVALDVRYPGTIRWDEIDPSARERFRDHANRMCVAFNPALRLRVMREAIDGIESWLNTPGGDKPELNDILLRVLNDYEFLLGKEDGRG